MKILASSNIPNFTVSQFLRYLVAANASIIVRGYGVDASDSPIFEGTPSAVDSKLLYGKFDRMYVKFINVESDTLLIYCSSK